jgi:heme-degrading monooxygenase HmoA
MIVTVFRSRLRPGVREEYVALVEKMAAIARTMPGYISHKGFFADDGERVTIVEFEHEEGLRAWRTNPDHIAAQKLARTKYYTEYNVQICRLERESKFTAADTAAAQA